MNLQTRRAEILKEIEEKTESLKGLIYGLEWKMENNTILMLNAKLSILDECIAEREKEFEEIKNEIVLNDIYTADEIFKIINKIKSEGVK